jgi:4-methylaminobutanoate oxidase (formaldehyde-forming)
VRQLQPFCLVFDDPQAWAWGGEAVLRGGEAIGAISSAGWSSQAGRCVAWVALHGDPAVAPEWFDADTPVQVELCSEAGVELAPARLAVRRPGVRRP